MPENFNIYSFLMETRFKNRVASEKQEVVLPLDKERNTGQIKKLAQAINIFVKGTFFVGCVILMNNVFCSQTIQSSFSFT